MKYALGYRPEPPDERDLLIPIPSYDLPKTVDWTEQLTQIRDQGNEGTCVGLAVTALKEFQEWRQYGTKFDFAERWIYEMAKEHDEWPGTDYEGTSIRAAMKALAQHGICQAKLWPYIPGRKGHPDAKAAENAYKYRIQKYRSLVTPKKDIRLIKRGLHETGPVVAGVAVHESWFNVGKNGVIHDPGSGAKIYGYHAILIMAYADDEELVKIKNSWGPAWGEEGFGYLDFGYFMRILHTCWAAYDYK